LLRSLRNAISAELRELPEDVLSWHPDAGEWCVKECLGHIVESERHGFNGRIRTILATPGLTFVPWDQEVVARERDDCRRPVGDLLSEFGAMREDSLVLVEALTEAELELGGTHPYAGYLRVRDLLHEWLHHDRNHFRQLLANVQAYVWPAMANAQRFSEELAGVAEALPADQG
jgi:hypothetical protein